MCYGSVIKFPSLPVSQQYIPLENPCFSSPQLAWLALCSAQYPVSQSQSRARCKHTSPAAVLWKRLRAPKTGFSSAELSLKCLHMYCMIFFYFRGGNLHPCMWVRNRNESPDHYPLHIGQWIYNKAGWLYKGLCAVANLSLWLLHFFLECSSFGPQKICTAHTPTEACSHTWD